MPIFSAAKERTSNWKVLRQFGHRGARQISACVGQSCRQESKRTSQQQQQQPTRHLSLFSVPGCTCVQGMRSLSSSFDVWELDCHLPRVLPKRRCRLFDAWAGGDAGMRVAGRGVAISTVPHHRGANQQAPRSTSSPTVAFRLSLRFILLLSLVSLCSISSFFPLILVLFTFILIFFLYSIIF